jgi:hypothetical protein
MLQNIKAIYGHKLTALDGDIGHVEDFYFDDKTWVIRYLVADTGSWLPGRQVLLSPHALGRFDPSAKVMLVSLTKQQIEHSPSIESDKPVSRQYEVEYYQYYGWPAYWNGGAMWGLGGYPVVFPPSRDELDAKMLHHRDNKHLQSTQSITGYAIHTSDGPIGQISGMMVDEKNWSIGDLVVETGHWYSGKEIFISSSKVNGISYEHSTVDVNVTKADIERTAEHQVVKAHAGDT